MADGPWVAVIATLMQLRTPQGVVDYVFSASREIWTVPVVKATKFSLRSYR